MNEVQDAFMHVRTARDKLEEGRAEIPKEDPQGRLYSIAVTKAEELEAWIKAKLL